MSACNSNENEISTSIDDVVVREPWLIDNRYFSCTDTIDSIYEDPGELSGEKGAILRCAEEAQISKDELYNYMTENGYEGAPFISGTTIYRVLYLTERANGDTGYATARLLLPTNPKADQLPVVISLRGSVGLAARCAASKHDYRENYGDFERQNFSLAGYGFAILATDLAGFANYGATGNPVFGYGIAKDEGKSALDGVSAMRNLLGERLSRKVVLLGQSQGGHSALSALAMSNSPNEAVSAENADFNFEHYGVDGELAGVALYAPLWISQRRWGGLMLLAALYPFDTFELANLVSIWYHYAQGEILDGEGHGVDIFKEKLRTGVKQLVDNACTGEDNVPALAALGSNLKEIVTPEFFSAVAMAAAMTGDCKGNELCEKWMGRYYSDRPHITGAASQVPILIAHSMNDTTVNPGRLSCVLDRLHADGVSVELCLEKERGGHSEIMDLQADFVADWIAAKTLNRAAQLECQTGLDDYLAMDISCEVPPTNE